MLCITTIVSGNYLAYARTLSDSVRVWEPDAEFRVLVVDRPVQAIQDAVKESGLNVTYVEDLGLPDIDQLAFKYDIVEFNTAVKPTHLKRLLAEGFDEVWYLDPDVRLYGPITPVREALSRASIALTPHSLAPVMDGARPSDIDFLRTGAYNLGFVGVRKSNAADQMLDWWEKRCLSYGFNDLGFGTFVDQKWMDLVPSYFDDVNIVKNPGCNVAYWNLHERRLNERSGIIQVNGQRLCFFHFSGVKADRADILSRHQTRHEVTKNSTLANLLSDYCECLRRNGQERFSRIEYTFGRFDDGEIISPHIRRLATFLGGEGDSPFASDGAIGRFRKSFEADIPKEMHLKQETTLNFSQAARKVIWTNRFVRLLVKALGLKRTAEFVRYMSLLNREANLLRVISRKEFEFSHREDYSRHIT
jgi:hypothetical protein